MSRITQQGLKESRWKVSKDSSFIQNDQSVIQKTFVLPQRFSPSKMNLNDSNFLASSLEKRKQAQRSISREPLASPRGLETSRIFNDDLKSSIEMKKTISPKVKTQSRFSLQNRDSILSVTQEDVEKIRKQAMKGMKKEYEGNRIIILELKK